MNTTALYRALERVTDGGRRLVTDGGLDGPSHRLYEAAKQLLIAYDQLSPEDNPDVSAADIAALVEAAEQARIVAESLDDDGGGSDSRPIPDGGQDIRSEWSLVCTDCDFEDELVTKGHPREGPPREVEDRVREHKGTADWSHVVRVEGRVADEDPEIDPSLLTDGGHSVNSTDRIGGAPLHPSDESPQLRYCHRCVGDTLHGWDGDCWVCETCGRRWSA